MSATTPDTPLATIDGLARAATGDDRNLGPDTSRLLCLAVAGVYLRHWKPRWLIVRAMERERALLDSLSPRRGGHDA